jgi:hypothetical protein
VVSRDQLEGQNRTRNASNRRGRFAGYRQRLDGIV